MDMTSAASSPPNEKENKGGAPTHVMAPPAIKQEDEGAAGPLSAPAAPGTDISSASTGSTTHQRIGSTTSRPGGGLPPQPPDPLPTMPPGQSLMTAVQWSPIVSESKGVISESSGAVLPAQPTLGSVPTDTTNGMEISIDEALGLIGSGAPSPATGLPDPSSMPEPILIGTVTPMPVPVSSSVGGGGARGSTSKAIPTTAAATKNTAPKKKTASGASPATSSAAPSTNTSSIGEETGDRRQRRLERNRESARLSRRRRKQYLEELEERVTCLSEEMDSGRREHVSEALDTVRRLRSERLNEVERDLGLDFAQLQLSSSGGRKANPVSLEHHVQALDTNLSRTSDELRIAATFQKQQLLSLSLPQNRKFILWLTIQNDAFYRGGRAASERLSAARIGERMLQCGKDRATPSGDMWPLFCNDVGLSYDQEEKIRAYQRTMLMENEPWLHRHTAAAADAAIEVTTKAIHGAAEMVQLRERALLDVLTVEQRAKFQAWASARKDRIHHVTNSLIARDGSPAETATSSTYDDPGLHLSPDRCDAANLYIVNNRLHRVCKILPAAPPLVRPASLKKLARRASFESLGSSMASLEAAGKKGGMAREKSFPSTGSLKRAASSMSMDDDLAAKQKEGPTPEAAEAASAPLVASALNDVRDIIPKSPPREFVNIAPPQAARGKPPSQRQSYGQQQQQKQKHHQPQQSQEHHYIHQGSYARAQETPSPANILAPQQIVSDFGPASPSSPLGLPLSASSTPVPVDVMSGVDVPMQPMHPGMAMPMEPSQQQQVANPSPVAGQDPGSFVETNHGRIPSLLPAHMNIVPEDGFLNNVSASATDDFLFDLMEGGEDWAIGEGFDMETPPT